MSVAMMRCFEIPNQEPAVGRLDIFLMHKVVQSVIVFFFIFFRVVLRNHQLAEMMLSVVSFPVIL